MAETTAAVLAPDSADQYSRPLWYAIYTCSRHEKQVARHLEGNRVEHFLPVYGSLRRWKDRKMRIEMPLFPGYLFGRFALRDRLQVLQAPGVVSLVSLNGRAVPVSDEEIALVRRGLESGLPLAPHAYLKIGQRVRIRSGAMAGVEGILLRRKGAVRVVISLDLIMRSMALEVDASEVEPVTAARLLR